MANTPIPEGKNKNKIDSVNTGKKSPLYNQEILESENKTKKEPDSVEKNIRYRSLVIDGTKYRTLLSHKFENRKNWISPDPKKVVSYIPGTIVKLFVREGQQVEKGEIMLILEAMKMKNLVVFSTSGKVKTVNVSEGEKIPKDYVMVELE